MQDQSKQNEKVQVAVTDLDTLTYMGTEWVEIDDVLALGAERDRYREALEKIVSARGYNGQSGHWLKSVAREALNGDTE